LNVSGDSVVVANNLIQVADDGVRSGQLGRVVPRQPVHALPAAAAAAALLQRPQRRPEIYDLVGSEIVGNVIYDVASTAALFFGNWADERQWLTSTARTSCSRTASSTARRPGSFAYLQDVRGVQVYGNVMWGFRDRAYSRLAIGTNVDSLVCTTTRSCDQLPTTSAARTMRRPAATTTVRRIARAGRTARTTSSRSCRFTGIPDADGAAVDNPVPEDFIAGRRESLVDAGWPACRYPDPRRRLLRRAARRRTSADE
jgi:hypothetical protein